MLTLAVTYAGVLGGLERELIDLPPGLPGRVVVACPEGPLANGAREAGIDVRPIASRPLELHGSSGAAAANLAGHAREVRSLVRELGPDLVVAWGMRSAIAAAAVVRAVPRRPGLLFRHLDFLPGGAVGRAVRMAARSADRVSVCSQAVGRDLDPAGELKDRLSVVYPGIDLTRLAPGGEPGREREVLLLGAIEPWKRPDLALEALALARSELPDVRLTVAGAPIGEAGHRLLAELRRRADRPDLAGHVTFAGSLDDPAGALRRAWCLLHCSEREPFGRVMAEALAVGRPVVAPDSAGPAEIVDPSCGVLYRPGDAADAAAALVEVLGDPGRARALGAAGPARAALFDLERTRARFGVDARAAAERRLGAPRSEATPARHSAIVVTWNAADVLDACLASLRTQAVSGELETIVVDNASTDATAEVLRRHADHVRVIRSDTNLGFSLGNNRGAEAATGEVLHFLNSDTELLQADALQRLGDTVLEPGVGLAGPRLVNPDGTLQPSASAHQTVARSLIIASGLHRLLPDRLRARVFTPIWSHTSSRDVDWVVGAAITVRADAFRATGGFWPHLYAEEQDLARKIEDRGLRVRFLHDVRVLHVGNVSNSQRLSSPERAARAAEAERTFLAEHYPPRTAALIRRITAAGHAWRAFVLRRLGEHERAGVYAAMARVLLRGDPPA